MPQRKISSPSARKPKPKSEAKVQKQGRYDPLASTTRSSSEPVGLMAEDLSQRSASFQAMVWAGLILLMLVLSMLSFWLTLSIFGD